MSKTRDFLPLENDLTPSPVVRRRFVAAIGIDDYQHLPRLCSAVNDATRVQEALVTHFGFEAPIAPLLNERATQKAILELVRDDLPALLQRDDSLLLFFAGHGTTRKRDSAPDTGYLAPVEVVFPPRFSSLVDMEHLLDDISRLEAHHILVILDACNSGMALETMRRTRQLPWYQADLDRKRSRKVITSARGDQLAADKGPMPGNSLFTGTLLEGLLHGHADLDGNGIVTSSKLGLYVQQRVAQQRGSMQTPEFGVFGSDELGELVFPLPSNIGTKRSTTTQNTEPFERQVLRRFLYEASLRRSVGIDALSKLTGERHFQGTQSPAACVSSLDEFRLMTMRYATELHDLPRSRKMLEAILGETRDFLDKWAGRSLPEPPFHFVSMSDDLWRFFTDLEVVQSKIGVLAMRISELVEDPEPWHIRNW